MIVKNPTEELVSIRIDGRDYSIPAGEGRSIIDADAAKWKKIHEFLVLEVDKSPLVKPIESIEVVEAIPEPLPEPEIVPEVAEEIVEEIVEKKKVAKKK